jgi:Ca2+-binding RTX toxin-like protein
VKRLFCLIETPFVLGKILPVTTFLELLVGKLNIFCRSYCECYRKEMVILVTQQEVIKKFVESLDKTNLRGTAAIDEAVRACSNFKSYSDLMNHILMDRKLSANGDEFLKNYCGIDFDTSDTGAITGSDAGGSVSRSAEHIVPEPNVATSTYPPNNSFSYKGLTIRVPSKSTLTENQQNIVAGIYTWWLKAGVDLVEETYGFSFQDSDVTFRTINIDFDENRWTHSFSTFYNNSAYQKTVDFTLHINSEIFSDITKSDTNGKNSSANRIEYLDRVIAFSFARAIMMAKIDYEYSMPDTIAKGIATLVDGYEDRRKSEIIELTDNIENLMKCTVSSNGEIPSNKFNIPMGFVALRYLAKQAVDFTPEEIQSDIPSDAYYYNGHYYKIYSNITSTWENAQKYCENLGGTLAIINDSEENTALFNYMKSKGYNSAYFGLSDVVTEGSWQWVDGSSVTYTNWASGEPNGRRSENYGMFYKDFNNGKWNDGDFIYDVNQHTANFICEWDTLSQDDDVEIDTTTTLEVINLFQNMDATEKKTTLKENLETLESLKTLVEGDKKIGIFDEETGKTFYADVNNLFKCIKNYYDEDAAPIITEYTNYIHDSNGRIVYKRKYKRDSAGNILRDAHNQPIREFELDANGNKIKIENNSKHREFMGNMLGSISDISEIFDSIKKLSNDDLNGVERTAEITKLNGSIVSLTGNIRSLGNFDKAGIIAPIASSVLGLVGSIISLFDGVKAEEVVDVVQKSLESATIFSKYVLNPEFANTKIGQLLGGQNFVNKVQPFAEKLNANALKINLGVSVALGLFIGGVQYFKSNEQYQIDGLKDSQAIKDKWTDAFTAGMKTFYSGVTGGLDDAVFGILSSTATNLVYLGEWFGTLIIGGDVSKVKKMSTGGKNYMELFGDFVKLVFLNQYTDPQGDKDGYMENTKVGRNIYSGGGNDSINNKASKANIYSGTGNDIIFCSEGTNQQYIDGGNDNDHIALYGSSNEIHGGLGDDQIDIFGDSKNPAGGNYILGEAGNDYIYVGDGKSKKKSSIANSIDGGAGDDIIFIDQTKTSNIIFYNNGDGNDEIFGYDSNDQIRINKSDYTTQFDGDDVKIIVGSGSMTLYDAKDKKLNITRTDIDIMPTGMTADKKKTTLTLSNKFKMQEVYLENYDKSFTKVNASGLAKTQPVAINGNSSDNSIKGGKGDDTLRGESGNDTLIGGSGNDIFIYEKGNDIITDYKAGEDKIQMNPSSITHSTVKGSDVVLTTSNGTLTIKSIKDKVVTFIDNNGKTTDKIFFADTSYSPLETGLTYDSKRTVLTASNKFSGSKINLDEHLATVTKINCSALSTSINIIGNSSANSLKGGKGADYIFGGNDKDTLIGGSGNDELYGGTDNDILKGESGNDSLYGGSGDDTLTGGAGNDWFVYEGGHDVITDYKAGEDSIKISGGKIFTISYNKKDVIFTIGSGTLTVKNAKGKKISVTDSSNKTQTYSKTLDLLCDNNFVTDELQLDNISDITETNYSVGQIHISTNYQNLETNSIISAFALEKK